MAELFRELIRLAFGAYFEAISAGARDLTPVRVRRVFAWIALGALAIFALIFRKEVVTIFWEQQLWIEALVGACTLLSVWFVSWLRTRPKAQVIACISGIVIWLIFAAWLGLRDWGDPPVTGIIIRAVVCLALSGLLWHWVKDAQPSAGEPSLDVSHSLLRSDQIPEPWRVQVEPTRALIRDEGMERAIAAMREAGLSIIGSIRVLAELGYPLGEAKRLVNFSQAWAFAREANERFHAEVEDAVTKVPDVVDERTTQRSMR